LEISQHVNGNPSLDKEGECPLYIFFDPIPVNCLDEESPRNKINVKITKGKKKRGGRLSSNISFISFGN